jgi:conserved oligomeric Golgi complex subunit 5
MCASTDAIYLADYSPFSGPVFDPNDYANAVLAGEPYMPAEELRTGAPPPRIGPEASSKEEISVAISKLSSGIENVSKQIKSLVTLCHCDHLVFSSLCILQVNRHHEDFLTQASNANQLSGSLSSVTSGLDELDSSLEK